MLELQNSVKTFLSEAESYLACNEDVVKGLNKRKERLDGASEIAEADQKINVWLSRYNNTVDEMHAVGDRFNQLVKAYRAQGSG